MRINERESDQGGRGCLVLFVEGYSTITIPGMLLSKTDVVVACRGFSFVTRSKEEESEADIFDGLTDTQLYEVGMIHRYRSDLEVKSVQAIYSMYHISLALYICRVQPKRRYTFKGYEPRLLDTSRRKYRFTSLVGSRRITCFFVKQGMVIDCTISVCSAQHTHTSKVMSLVFWVNLGTIDSRPCLAAAPSPSTSRYATDCGGPCHWLVCTTSYILPRSYIYIYLLRTTLAYCLTGYEPRLSG